MMIMCTGAKRSLSNTCVRAQEMIVCFTAVMCCRFYLANEALETPSKMQEYLLQICADSKSGLVAVNAIEIQRQIAFKTYKLVTHDQLHDVCNLNPSS